MDKKKIIRFKEGKKIKKATRIPNAFLRLKGKSDSKKTPAAADAYIGKLCARCSAIENLECVTAEEILHPYRLEASQILASINNNKLFLKNTPISRNEKSAIDIRANIRNQTSKNSVVGEIKSLINRLCELNEVLINTDSCLQQRIQKTRNLCSEKINVYILGLRSGNLPDYSYDIEYSDAAIKSYTEKHNVGDTAIREHIEKIFDEVKEGA